MAHFDQRVHKRVYTSVLDGYLVESEPVPEQPGEYDTEDLRVAYYLDPWSNPYWLLYERNGLGLFYSFGPNRRRDSDGWTLGGDDIGADIQRLPAEPG